MLTSAAASRAYTQADRVRNATPERINRRIDRQIDVNIARYGVVDGPAIQLRMTELDGKWDIERVLEVNTVTLARTLEAGS